MANDLPKIMNYINGELVPPNSKKYIDNIEPATGNTYSLIPDSDVIDVKNAIKSAEKAFKKWSNVSVWGVGVQRATSTRAHLRPRVVMLTGRSRHLFYILVVSSFMLATLYKYAS